MAVVRVEIDIDSDVYPELHAALAALRQPMLREERLRQLAAMGLAWEAVRIHGAAVTQVPARQALAAETPAIGSRSAPRAPAKSPARKVRPEASEPAQLPVLVDIVSASAAELDRPPHEDPADGPDPPVDPMPVTAANRGSGARSRLMRMKDRGLFKNG
jgi:hypothetical protein